MTGKHDWCKGCGELFYHDDPADSTCSPGCETEWHRRCLGLPRETPGRPTAVSRPMPPPTLSRSAAWRELAEQASNSPCDRADVEALETYRRALSTPTNGTVEYRGDRDPSDDRRDHSLDFIWPPRR